MSEQKSVTIQTLGVCDRNDVVEFLRTSFYADEPLLGTLGIANCADLESHVCVGLADGCCFKAVNDDGDIVAVKLSHIAFTNVKYGDTKTEHPLYKIRAAFFRYIHTKHNLFGCLPEGVDRCVVGKAMSVREDYRNLGIATALYRRTMDWMVENGIQHMITGCTGLYTALACKKLGFAEVFSMNYTDYVVDGVCPIVPAFPHTTMKAFITTV